MEYQIVQARNIYDLMREVRDRGAEGWRPRGGVSSYPIGNATWFLQALVRDAPAPTGPAMGQQGADVVIPQPHARAMIVVEALIGEMFEASSPQDEMGIRGRGRSTAEAIGKLILHRGRALGIDVELPK